jgi:hypothetical protein
MSIGFNPVPKFRCSSGQKTGKTELDAKDLCSNFPWRALVNFKSCRCDHVMAATIQNKNKIKYILTNDKISLKFTHNLFK